MRPPPWVTRLFPTRWVLAAVASIVLVNVLAFVLSRAFFSVSDQEERLVTVWLRTRVFLSRAPTRTPTTLSPSRSPTYVHHVYRLFVTRAQFTGAEIANATRLCRAERPDADELHAVLFATHEQNVSVLVRHPTAPVLFDDVIVAHDTQDLLERPGLHVYFWAGAHDCDCGGWTDVTEIGCVGRVRWEEFHRDCATARFPVLCLEGAVIS